jgi:hypothetical protein
MIFEGIMYWETPIDAVLSKDLDKCPGLEGWKAPPPAFRGGAQGFRGQSGRASSPKNGRGRATFSAIWLPSKTYGSLVVEIQRWFDFCPLLYRS